MKAHYPQRKSPRLQGYDYAQAGAYFVTICTHERQHLFCEVEGEDMCLTPLGAIAATCWDTIPSHYPDVDLDAFVVMPNHIHGILVLTGATSFKTVLGRVVNGYKGAVTARIRKLGDENQVVWQSRYHDHIIRNERGLNNIRAYIATNPARWQQDRYSD
jgi:putative transposase